MPVVTIEEVAKFLRVNPRRFRIPLLAFFRLFGIFKLNKTVQLHEQYEGQEFADKILEYLNISIDYDADFLSQLPGDKNIIIVSNHPFGVVDGLALIKIFCAWRPGFKIVLHRVLKIIDPIQPVSIFVNPVRSKKKYKHMYREAKAILGHLRQNQGLILFPAGRVACFNFRQFQVTDRDWNEASLKMLTKTKALIIPTFIEGKNSFFFELLNFINTELGFLWVIRESYRKSGKRIKIRFGEPIETHQFTEQEIARVLRDKVYFLKK